VSGEQPDNTKYWDALAARVTREVLRSESDALTWLAGSRTAWLAACALAVLGVGSIVYSSKDVERTEKSIVLVPSDEVGQILAGSEKPPNVGVLLTARSGRNER